MFCFNGNNFNCGSIWETLCRYFGVGAAGAARPAACLPTRSKHGPCSLQNRLIDRAGCGHTIREVMEHGADLQ